jgi:hypothetical protein
MQPRFGSVLCQSACDVFFPSGFACGVDTVCMERPSCATWAPSLRQANSECRVGMQDRVSGAAMKVDPCFDACNRGLGPCCAWVPMTSFFPSDFVFLVPFPDAPYPLHTSPVFYVPSLTHTFLPRDPLSPSSPWRVLLSPQSLSEVCLGLSTPRGAHTFMVSLYVKLDTCFQSGSSRCGKGHPCSTSFFPFCRSRLHIPLV